MTPEQAQAVWTLQASHVAGKLELSKEQTAKLVDAYKKARESYNKAVRKAWAEARASADVEDRRAMFRAMREAQGKLTKAETDKFAKAVGAILDKEETKLAVTHLGTFSGELDRMVSTIAGLKLDEAKQAKALDIVSGYVVESTAAREKAMAGGDRQAMRAVFQKQRTKLNEAMGKVLSEEELAKWAEATGPRGGGMGSDSSGMRRRRRFTKQVEVLGIHVLATADSSDEIVLHVANVLAEYLDNDEDGVADNQEVMDALISNRSTYQHANDAEVHPNGAAEGLFDASLEEVLHMITDQGYGAAYPEVFGRVPGTEISNALDKARGARFMKVPEQYPDDAWFTYDDETCDYDCMNSEYIYWVLTSILGAQDYPGRLQQIEREWRLNTREKVKEGDPDAYALFTDPKYKFPTVLPDGDYKGKKFTIKEYP
jgi:hypothetical protein